MEVLNNVYQVIKDSYTTEEYTPYFVFFRNFFAFGL